MGGSQSAEIPEEPNLCEKFKDPKYDNLKDFNFIVGREGTSDIKVFGVHKQLMCVASDVFNAMFTGDLAEQDEVRIKDVPHLAFGLMIDDIYSKEVDLKDVPTALEVLKAANKYLLQNLSRKCIKYIKDELSSDHVCSVLFFTMNFETPHKKVCEDLQTTCMEKIQACTGEVLAAKTWVDTKSSTILKILDQDNLNIEDEMSLLDACVRWCKHRESRIPRIRALLKEFLAKIRIKNISVKDFLTLTKNNPDLFTYKEIYEIVSCIELDSTENLFNKSSTVRGKPPKTKKLYKSDLQVYSPALLTQNCPNHEQKEQGCVLQVKRDLEVYAVTYKTLPDTREGPVSTLQSKTYEESIKITVKNLKTGSPNMEPFTYNEPLPYDAEIDIAFPEPYLLRKNNWYNLNFTFSKSSEFPKLKFFPDLHKKKNNLALQFDTMFICGSEFCDIVNVFYKLKN